MTRTTRILLVLGAIAIPPGLLIITGVIKVGTFPELHVVFPVGIVFLGMALISHALEKEVAAYEADQKASHRSSSPSHGRKNPMTQTPLKEKGLP